MCFPKCDRELDSLYKIGESMWKFLIVSLAFLFSFPRTSIASSCQSCAQEIVIDVNQLENIGDMLGTPTKVWFVNNTNVAFGDGSFANPFNTLLAAQIASATTDVIYVFAGDGTSTGMDQGFVMKDDQKVLGAGIDHIFYSCQGNVRVLAGSATLPMITNTNANVAAVTLANSCEVAGLHITGTNGGDGILGGDPNPAGPSTLGISHTNIHNNTIDNAAVTDGAIYLANCQGQLIIANNFIENITSTNFAVGIDVFYINFPVSSSIILKNNTVLTSGFFGIFVESFAPNGHVSCIAEDNFVSDCQSALLLAGLSGSPEMTICGRIRRNTLQNSIDNGLTISTSNGAIISAEISGNHLIANGNIGFEAHSFNSSTVCVKLLKNVSDNGFNLFQFDSSVFNAASSNGALSGIQRVNTGAFSTSGTINYVPLGTCNCLTETCCCN